MMTNLFSIFDPSTPWFLATNWLSTFIVFLIFPCSIWVMSNRASKMFMMLMKYIFNEFQPLVKKTPYILVMSTALFMFIMLNNTPGLLPYIFTSSSHMVYSLSMALSLWLGLTIFSLINNTSNTLIHLIPQGTPNLLAPFMVLIEITSNLIRPITLAVRLSANMIAGHLLVSLLMNTTITTPLIMSPLIAQAQMALMGLELAVAFIQAYVFSVLVTLYTAESNS